MNKNSIRTYSHETLHGALAALKNDLGEEAFIVRTRQVEKKGLFGIKGKPHFEIQACPADHSVKGPPTKVNSVFSKTYGLSDSAQSPQPLSPSSSSDKKKFREIEKLSQDVASMKAMLQEMVLRSREKDELTGLNDEIQNLYSYLVNQGVRETRARSLVKELNHDLKGEDLRNPRRLRDELKRRLVDRIPVAQSLSPVDGRPRVAAFIGPTGVGKTTTISKLAGYYHHYQQLDVALMTLDTYRIAATEQLHRVAEIVDVPIRCETSPTSLRQGLETFANRDLILIDTAGRSQRDTLQMNELKKFIEAAQPDDIFLVLPVNQDVHCLEQVLERFGSIANQLILSKLDETVRLGPVLDLLMNNDLPVSYWTFGQSIPDDIAAVNSRRLAKLLIGEETL